MYNVLIIDDEKSIVSMLTMALAKYGFNAEIAVDGSEGIKKFDEGRFDLVITDILRCPVLMAMMLFAIYAILIKNTRRLSQFLEHHGLLKMVISMSFFQNLPRSKP